MEFGNEEKSLASYRLFGILKGMVNLNEAYARLASLSQERAQRVFSLIEDLADLEALESVDDLIAAKNALANPESVLWENLKTELDEIHH